MCVGVAAVSEAAPAEIGAAFALLTAVKHTALANVSASADRKIKVWNFELGEQQRSIDAAGKEVTGVTFAGTGGLLVSGSGDRNVRIHNADDGAVVRTISGAAGYLFCCAATETGKLIVAGGEDRVLRVWNGEDGTEVVKIEPAK